MAQFKPSGKDLKKLLKSKQVEQRALMPAAKKVAGALEQTTPKSDRPGGGGTAASTHVEPGHMSVKGDRVAVRVAQRSYSGRGRPRGGASAPLQFGNAITAKRNQFAAALRAAG